jgi:hypothetical protein
LHTEYENSSYSIHFFFFFIFVILAPSLGFAQTQHRRTIWNLFFGEKKDAASHREIEAFEQNDTANATSTKNPSPFSFGTFAGVTWAFEDLNSYKIIPSTTTNGTPTNGIVALDREGSGSGRLTPVVLAFPSAVIATIGKNDFPVSFIVPLGASRGEDLRLEGTYGLGLSFGFNTIQSAWDIGATIALVWSSVPVLTPAQQISYNTQTPLPSYETTSIGSDVKPT